MLSMNTRKKASAQQLDLVLHAISDQTRRALLARLARGPAMVTELAEPFNMSLPAVSKHLRMLERARLVERSVKGRVHSFSLAPERLQAVEQWLSHYRSFWGENLERLASFTEKPTRGLERVDSGASV
jgi:DNA-binding transcriptional ArsR family regulator